LDENKLIAKAQEGHRLSMNILLENHYKMLYAFMLKLSMDEELAKDMTQEAMIKAVVYIKKFRGDSKFSTWLIRIGINHYKNHMKKYKTISQPLDEFMVSHDNVENQVLAREQLREIYKFLENVKPIDRVIFTLKYLEGYDNKEISQLTGVKVGTCKSKMHYLVDKMKVDMEVT